jgi:hypothetical protein
MAGSRGRQRKAELQRAEERKRADDLEEAGRVGEEHGLGTVEAVRRETKSTTEHEGLGCLFLFLALCGALPAAIAVTVATSLTTLMVILWVTFGVLFILGPLVTGEKQEVVTKRVAVYPGGVAQILPGQPVPQVLRWADVGVVTVSLDTDEGTPLAGLSTCRLLGLGTEIAEGEEAAAFALAAHRALAPRFVPRLIQAYESGQPVMAGNGHIDHLGVTPPGSSWHLAWTEIESVTMEHDSTETVEVVTKIDIIGRKRSQSRTFDPSGIPNGIFLAHLIAHAAARNGIQVDGYQPPRWG